MQNNASFPKYRLRDQRRFDMVTIEENETGACFTVHAAEIVKNRYIIDNLSSHDSMVIGYIASNSPF